MQLIDWTVNKGVHKTYLFSDLHVGGIFFHKKAYEKVIEEVKNEQNTQAVFVGDAAEGRASDHPYFDMKTADPDLMLPVQQYEWFEKSIADEKISKKIVTIMEGNHDSALAHKYGDQLNGICNRLGIKFGTTSCVITFRDEKGKQLYKIYCHHGAGTIKSSAGDIIRREANIRESIKRKLKNKFSDCSGKFMAHTHKLYVVPPEKRLHLLSDGSKIEQVYSQKHGRSRIIHPDDVWYGNTGSFQKQFVLGVSGYGERRMYDPLEMGYLKIISTPEGDDIQRIEKVVV